MTGVVTAPAVEVAMPGRSGGGVGIAFDSDNGVSVGCTGSVGMTTVSIAPGPSGVITDLAFGSSNMLARDTAVWPEPSRSST